MQHKPSLWSTPRASDGEKGGPNQKFSGGGQPLPAQAAEMSAALWATPKASDGDGGRTTKTIGGGQRTLADPGEGNDGCKCSGQLQHGGTTDTRTASHSSCGGGYEGRATGEPGSAWSDASWITGSDGKSRRVKSGVRLLAHGVSGRVAVYRTVEQGGTEIQETHTYSRIGALRGFGNAIVPQVAAEFIKAYIAAIRAMREPTPAIIAAGESTPVIHRWRDADEYIEDPESVWSAMIDAASPPT